MLRDWGSWELADVLSYAIGYAQKGIHLVPRIPAAIASVQPLFEQEWPTSAAVFLRNGQVPAAGSLHARPALAETWLRLCREATGTTREARIDSARNAWYRGFVAEAVDRFFRTNDVMDVSGRRHRGLLTADDMARWSAGIVVATPSTTISCNARMVRAMQVSRSLPHTMSLPIRLS